AVADGRVRRRAHDVDAAAVPLRVLGVARARAHARSIVEMPGELAVSRPGRQRTIRLDERLRVTHVSRVRDAGHAAAIVGSVDVEADGIVLFVVESAGDPVETTHVERLELELVLRGDE